MRKQIAFASMFTFIFLFSGLSFSAYAEYAVDNNTIALYHANEDSGTILVDATGNYHANLKDTGGPQWTTESRLGSHALLFDGHDDYIVQDTLLDEFPENGTIEFWFNPRIALDATTEENYWFISKDNVHPPENHLTFMWFNKYNVHPAKLCLGMDVPEQYVACSTTPAFEAGTWYHIAGTWGSTGMHFYVNGLEEGNNSFTGKIANGNEYDFYIGRSGVYPMMSPFYGIIDEIRISDIQRTSFPPFMPECGNGICEINETYENCPPDCILTDIELLQLRVTQLEERADQCEERAAGLENRTLNLESEVVQLESRTDALEPAVAQLDNRTSVLELAIPQLDNRTSMLELAVAQLEVTTGLMQQGLDLISSLLSFLKDSLREQMACGHMEAANSTSLSALGLDCVHDGKKCSCS